jgi:lipopolysaccharide/colanic/teichoic acid biosynthesis glycosyltransferase
MTRQTVATRARAPAPEPLSVRYARLANERLAQRPQDGVLRCLDLALAGAASIVLAPVALVVGLAILADSGAPVLYRGRRVGRGGDTFTMYKFRTLAPDAETRLGPYMGSELDALTPDEHTRVGRVLRDGHLDELPQLFNVLRGDMSIVGPRPIRPVFFEQLCVQIPQYWQRLVVRPGMTGFAQLRITRDMTWSEKLVHDFEYIADRSVGLYVRIVAVTAGRVARRLLLAPLALVRRSG